MGRRKKGRGPCKNESYKVLNFTFLFGCSIVSAKTKVCNQTKNILQEYELSNYSLVINSRLSRRQPSNRHPER